MHDHSVPVIGTQLVGHMSRNIVVNFSEVLLALLSLSTLSTRRSSLLTDTKKLLVPSARTKVSGKSLSHVSSPYMISLPSPSFILSLICASHVSCVASVEDVSDSAKFRITSRKDGIDPVVIALTRGIVIVGDVACAVKGRASPLRIRLSNH